MANYTNETKVLKTGQYYRDTKPDRIPARVRYYLLAKRTMDILGSLAGIFLFLPVLIAISVLIKLEDPKGNVFFKQIRVGKDGKLFKMYKLRSMVWNAEELLEDLLERNEINGAMFKMKDDPRTTKIGKFIRKTSIDELPQLWNVLNGDMSLVGPRPPLPWEVERYSSYHKQRLLVTPGCTGIWQVSGRNGLSFEQMVELDLYYIKHRTVWLDIKLIVKTFWVIVCPRNAY